MVRIRISTVAIVTVAVMLLVVVGTQTTKASNPGAQTAAGNATLQTEPSGPQGAEPETCSTVEQAGAAAGGNPCKDCPKNLAPSCTRVSCDPCCFRCPGEPFLRCL